MSASPYRARRYYRIVSNGFPESVRAELWRALSAALGDVATWDGAPVRVRLGVFAVSLGVHADLAGRASDVVTRVRAAYANPTHFRFRLRPQSLFDPLRVLFGVVDDPSNDPVFDRRFTAETDDPARLAALLRDAELRTLLLAAPWCTLEVRDDEDWFAQDFPDGTDELHLEVDGRVIEPERLEALFRAFARTLDGLMRLDAKVLAAGRDHDA